MMAQQMPINNSTQLIGVYSIKSNGPKTESIEKHHMKC